MKEITLEKLKRMEWLVENLNRWTKLYDEGNPEISDKEWDKYYFELMRYERDYPACTFKDSPTQKVSYQVVNQLNKVIHNHLMLSLDKTKEVSDIIKFAGDKEIIAMQKMDGLTVSLRYVGGRLVSAETRGNGEVGEDILHNALVIASIPKRIEYTDELIVDGEIICTTDNFEPFADKYKNPRNFAAGSLRLLDSKECEKRNLTFVAWDIIDDSDEKKFKTLTSKLCFLDSQGFTIVDYMLLQDIEAEIEYAIRELTDKAQLNFYPIDGLVFKYDDCNYYRSLGHTSHHFRGGIAFKFYDEEAETSLIEIEWSLGKTGVLTPVAIFEPIELEGTSVSRASLHNLSIMKELYNNDWCKGLILSVIKSNQIIPQITKVEYRADCSEKLEIPKRCPVCGGETTIVTSENGVKNLMCLNSDCGGQLLSRLDHFCSKKGLDIKGMSKMTLEKLFDWGWLNNIEDIFKLKDHRTEWCHKAGFGVTSVDKILNKIDECSNCTLESFLSSLSIPLVGLSVAKVIAANVKTYDNFREMIEAGYDFSSWNNFGEALNRSISEFDYTEADILAEKYLHIQEVEEAESSNSSFEGITVCITGKLRHFKSRSQLVDIITKAGGRVTDSVSKKTTLLVTNDINSGTAKVVSATRLGIPMLTEEEFLNQYNLEGTI